MINPRKSPACRAILALGALALTACSEPEVITLGMTESETVTVAEEGVTETMTATEPEVLADSPAASGGSFLALSDVHFRPDNMPCHSSEHHCETPPAFWTATQGFVQGVVASETPDFIIYLGDMPTHAPVAPGPRGDIFASVLNGLSGLAGVTDIPVLYLPGNNDTLGHNPGYNNDYCPFDATGHTVLDYASDPSAWPVVNGASDVLDASHLSNGYYAARLTVGSTGSPLRVLALNTNIYTAHYGLCSDQAAADGSDQLDWLAGQLADAASASEPVLLDIHVPPGFDGYQGHRTSPGTMWDDSLAYQGSNPAYAGRWMQDVMLDLIAAHSDTITNVIAGHTHLNGIRRLHTCEATPSMSELLVSIPGISADHGNRPAFKLFQLDGATEPVAVTTYNAAYSGGYDWSDGASFDFSANYPNTAPSGATLAAQIESLDTDAVFTGMLRYLNAHDQSPPPAPGFFRQALDVTCRN